MFGKKILNICLVNFIGDLFLTHTHMLSLRK